jgi:hypothetical protein
MLNEGNRIHNFMFVSGSGTIINDGSGSGILTSYGFGFASQKVILYSILRTGTHIDWRIILIR